jgi:hypothetical protein
MTNAFWAFIANVRQLFGAGRKLYLHRETGWQGGDLVWGYAKKISRGGEGGAEKKQDSGALHPGVSNTCRDVRGVLCQAGTTAQPLSG